MSSLAKRNQDVVRRDDEVEFAPLHPRFLAKERGEALTDLPPEVAATVAQVTSQGGNVSFRVAEGPTTEHHVVHRPATYELRIDGLQSYDQATIQPSSLSRTIMSVAALFLAFAISVYLIAMAFIELAITSAILIAVGIASAWVVYVGVRALTNDYRNRPK